MVEQVFLDGVAVQPGDGAQAAGDRRPRPPLGFHVPAEGLDARPAGGEQMHTVLPTPGHVLPQVQRVRVPGQGRCTRQGTRPAPDARQP